MKKMLLLALFVSQFAQAYSFYIYGGKADHSVQWSSAVAIGFSEDQIFCSGVVFTDDKVLTAAHCVRAFAAQELTEAGKIFLGPGGRAGFKKAVRIKSIKTYGNYDQTKEKNINDFAVITLAEKVTDVVRLMPLLSAYEGKFFFSQTMHEIVHVGYGERENGDYGERYVTRSETTEFWEREFVAGLGDGRGTCHGDSGGPVYAQLANKQWRVVGITSRGPDSNGQCETFGGVYGRTDLISLWATK